MRFATLLVILCIAFSISAQENAVEIGGTWITPGMPEAEVRDAFSSIYCAEKEEPDVTDWDYCDVRNGESWESGGMILFENGRVKSARRNWRLVDDLESYELFFLLHEILSAMTHDFGTCGKVYARSQGPDFRRSHELTLVLPKRYVNVTIVKLGDEHRVSIQESTRVNPVPDSQQVHGRTQGGENCGLID